MHTIQVVMDGYLINKKVKMVASFRDKLYFVLVIFITMLLGCSKNEQEQGDPLKNYIKQNFKGYEDVYNIALDSIKFWKEENRLNTKFLVISEYALDSAFIFNRDCTRLFSSINCSIQWENATSDDIIGFGGAKINGHWYFLRNASTGILRSAFQDSMYAPLTFQELSIISHLKIFPRFEKDSSTGAYIFDEEFMEATFYKPFDYLCKSHKNYKACCDSVWLEKAYKFKNEKWNEVEVQKIMEEMAQSVKPREPPRVRRDWWERWRDPYKPKMFGRKTEDEPLR